MESGRATEEDTQTHTPCVASLCTKEHLKALGFASALTRKFWRIISHPRCPCSLTQRPACWAPPHGAESRQRGKSPARCLCGRKASEFQPQGFCFSSVFSSNPLLTQRSPSPSTSEDPLEEILSLTGWLLHLYFYWRYLSQIFAQPFSDLQISLLASRSQ